MKTINLRHTAQRGFTIVEALIAVVIMGFGILSLAGMQGALSRNADQAKQRTEAVRLAQEKMEELRSFTGIVSTTVGQGTASISALNWNAMAGNNDTITTNATYTRTWSLGGAADDPLRGLSVIVAWTDRAGEAQSVTLSSMLAKTDPSDSGFLAFPLPLNTNLKRPKNRNLDIPIRAIDLGNGESALRYGSTGDYVVFGNLSGDVVKICAPALSSSPTDAQVISALLSADATVNACRELKGYIVAGYIQRDISVSNADWSAIQASLGINTANVVRNAPGTDNLRCQVEDAVNQTTGAALAGYKSYLCVIPLAAPSPGQPYNWSGTIRISGPAAWRASNSAYFACRFQYVRTNSLTDPNQRNIQPYVNVDKSIDQQNFVIATTATSSSATAPTCPTSMTESGVSLGVLHQDCRSASNPAGYLTACPLVAATP